MFRPEAPDFHFEGLVDTEPPTRRQLTGRVLFAHQLRELPGAQGAEDLHPKTIEPRRPSDSEVDEAGVTSTGVQSLLPSDEEEPTRVRSLRPSRRVIVS